MYELMVRSDFSAAHRLDKYTGKCARLHGHNWKVEVVLRTARLNREGMVMDARKVKKIVENFLECVDHKYLNELPYFARRETTSENIAKFIYKGLKSKLAKLARVRVWESDSVAVSFNE